MCLGKVTEKKTLVHPHRTETRFFRKRERKVSPARESFRRQSMRRSKAAPPRSIPMRIGMPRNREEGLLHLRQRDGAKKRILTGLPTLLFTVAGKGKGTTSGHLTAMRSPAGERTHRQENRGGAMYCLRSLGVAPGSGGGGNRKGQGEGPVPGPGHLLRAAAPYSRCWLSPPP
jgi:hypothetical protein